MGTTFTFSRSYAARAWRYTSALPYALKAWCSIKHKDTFTFTMSDEVLKVAIWWDSAHSEVMKLPSYTAVLIIQPSATLSEHCYSYYHSSYNSHPECVHKVVKLPISFITSVRLSLSNLTSEGWSFVATHISFKSVKNIRHFTRRPKYVLQYWQL